MPTVLITFIVAFVITIIALPAIIKVAEEKKIFDVPDARKLHARSISSLGGVSIFIGFFLSTLIFTSEGTIPEFQYFCAAAVVMFFLGLKDDILILSANKKFLGQLAAVAILIHVADVRLVSMNGFLGIYQLPYAVSVLFTYLTFIVIINAYNLIDGVDGLAGLLGIVATLAFGCYFLTASMHNYALISFAMTGCLAAFILFNFSPAKIFMGDSGSLLLGLTNAFLVIKFIAVASAATAAVPLTASIAIAFAILGVPLFDTLRVFGIRIMHRRSPFSPDRNHIHHLLLDRGFNHRQVAVGCAALNVALVAVAYFGRALGTTLLIGVLGLCFFAFISAVTYLKKSVPRLVVAKSFQAAGTERQGSSKVVALQPEASAVEQ